MAEPAPGEESFGTLLRPVEMRTAGQRIAERLVTAIALGEFESGQRLPPARGLAAAPGGSRTTVAGAPFIQAAAAAGTDAAEAVKRTLGPQWDELTELLDYRRLTETLIARTAA